MKHEAWNIMFTLPTIIQVDASSVVAKLAVPAMDQWMKLFGEGWWTEGPSGAHQVMIVEYIMWWWGDVAVQETAPTRDR